VTDARDIDALLERVAVALEAVEARLAAPEPTRSRAVWLRVEQVAQEYGVSRATVYDWIYRKRVTTKKLGKAKRSPVLLYRPDVEKLATIRRPVRALLDGP
jgi:hypothetical protein